MKIFHVTDGWKGAGADVERIARAQASWEGFGIPLRGEGLDRDSSMLGSARRVRFVQDVIDQACSHTSDLEDVIVLTNSDVGLALGLRDVVLGEAGNPWACYSHRQDWNKRVRRPVTIRENMAYGTFSSGIDLVAMNLGWWLEERDRIPDLMLGCEGWDWVFKYLMTETMAKQSDPEAGLYCPAIRKGWIWHELHGVPVWREGEVGDSRPELANMVNRMLCLEWWRGLGFREEVRQTWTTLAAYERDWDQGGQQVLVDAFASGLRTTGLATRKDSK